MAEKRRERWITTIPEGSEGDPRSAGASAAIARLGAAGQKTFDRRSAIIGALFEATTGLTAPEIRDRVRASGCHVSLATVQLTLRRLLEHGLAHVERRAGTLARFSANRGGQDDGRLVCIHCHSSAPFTDPRVTVLHRKISQMRGFAVQHHRLEVFGTCGRCQVARGH